MRSATLLAFLPLTIAAPFPNAKRDVPARVIVPRGGKVIDGKYIVRMKSGSMAASINSAIDTIKADADHTYSRSFRGFAASIDADELEMLRDDPNVEYIEQDAVVSIYTPQTIQEHAPWGLARLSASKPGGTTYTYKNMAGEGVCAYSVDTGVDITHPEFEGRAVWGKNFVDDSDKDGQGHGTHTAGTMASKTYGVAKKARIIAVKVLDDSGSGSYSDVIAGMEYVIKDVPERGCPKGAVVNMSLGGSLSKAINDAAASIVSAGIFLAVAAGNDASDAAQYSPASEKTACTVGATTDKDELATFSNFGPLVDVLAPGVGIMSSVPGNMTKTLRGTSMAAPHVAGLAAYFLSVGEKAEGLCDYIVKEARKGLISGLSNGTANALANNGNY